MGLRSFVYRWFKNDDPARADGSNVVVDTRKYQPFKSAQELHIKPDHVVLAPTPLGQQEIPSSTISFYGKIEIDLTSEQIDNVQKRIDELLGKRLERQLRAHGGQ